MKAKVRQDSFLFYIVWTAEGKPKPQEKTTYPTPSKNNLSDR